MHADAARSLVEASLPLPMRDLARQEFHRKANGVDLIPHHEQRIAPEGKKLTCEADRVPSFPGIGLYLFQGLNLALQLRPAPSQPFNFSPGKVRVGAVTRTKRVVRDKYEGFSAIKQALELCEITYLIIGQIIGRIKPDDRKRGRVEPQGRLPQFLQLFSIRDHARSTHRLGHAERQPNAFSMQPKNPLIQTAAS